MGSSSTSFSSSLLHFYFCCWVHILTLLLLLCKCFPLLTPYNSHKLVFQSLPYVFLGYSPSHHAYKCYNLTTKKLIVVRYVAFDENSLDHLFSPSIHSGKIHATGSSIRTHGMQTRSMHGIFRKKVFHATCHPIPEVLVVAYDESEPTCYTHASKSSCWKEAMASEFNALMETKTWELRPRTPGMNVIGCK